MTPSAENGATADLARRLARRLEADPGFLAATLRAYAEAEGLDEAGLAVALGVAADQLPQIALCRRPRPELFREDVEAVAERFGGDPRRLAELIRHVDARAALGRAAAAGRAGLAAAARDHAADEGSAYDASPPVEDSAKTARDDGSGPEGEP